MVTTSCVLYASRCVTTVPRVRLHGSRGGVFVDHRPPPGPRWSPAYRYIYIYIKVMEVLYLYRCVTHTHTFAQKHTHTRIYIYTHTHAVCVFVYVQVWNMLKLLGYLAILEPRISKDGHAIASNDSNADVLVTPRNPCRESFFCEPGRVIWHSPLTFSKDLPACPGRRLSRHELQISRA